MAISGPMAPGARANRATSTKISGSAGSCGWKKAKQRRSGCKRRRKSSQPSISCTASCWMSFSSSCAGEFQSTRAICRNPGLNQLDSKCRKSASTACNSGLPARRGNNAWRIETMLAVPPGERLMRRRSSCRGGSTSRIRRCKCAALGSFAYACALASMRAGVGPKSLASRSKNWPCSASDHRLEVFHQSSGQWPRCSLRLAPTRGAGNRQAIRAGQSGRHPCGAGAVRFLA